MFIKFDPDDYNDIIVLMRDIKDVHKSLFPKATLQSQAAKYEEECIELATAKNGKELCEEFADMFIVACGLMRFSSQLGVDLCRNIIRTIKDDESRALFIETVCNKMNINQSRDWNETSDGFYKHKEYSIH